MFAGAVKHSDKGNVLCIFPKPNFFRELCERINWKHYIISTDLVWLINKSESQRDCQTFPFASRPIDFLHFNGLEFFSASGNSHEKCHKRWDVIKIVLFFVNINFTDKKRFSISLLFVVAVIIKNWFFLFCFSSLCLLKTRISISKSLTRNILPK